VKQAAVDLLGYVLLLGLVAFVLWMCDFRGVPDEWVPRR